MRASQPGSPAHDDAGPPASTPDSSPPAPVRPAAPRGADADRSARGRVRETCRRMRSSPPPRRVRPPDTAATAAARSCDRAELWRRGSPAAPGQRLEDGSPWGVSRQLRAQACRWRFNRSAAEVPARTPRGHSLPPCPHAVAHEWAPACRPARDGCEADLTADGPRRGSRLRHGRPPSRTPSGGLRQPQAPRFRFTPRRFAPHRSCAFRNADRRFVG